MKTYKLTNDQLYVIEQLNARGAYSAAHDFETAWKCGQPHYLDARNGARRGLVRAIDKGNADAIHG